jgi:hypothetical protein
MRASPLLGLALVALAGPGAPAQDAPASGPNRYALLVGCTRYPNLAQAYQLRGPANDVLLLRDFLVNRFGFPREHVVILAESEGENNRPTRAHIEREFKRLAEVARPGDQVVITMSGHGSQQPDSTPDDPENYEPDGLDETFLPADVGHWDDGKKRVENAIIDNELRDWLKAIRAKKASVLIVIDACHSATMVRGSEQLRQVRADVLVPEEAIKKAQEYAEKRWGKSRGAEDKPSPFKLPVNAPDLVAIYACQSTEPTVEKRLPPDSPDAKPYGLLTYTLVQVLAQASTPMTYAELVQRIRAQYVKWGRASPTPLVEGKDQDREFLGLREWPGRSRFRVQRDEEEGWKVNAGALHGLMQGSILAVYPPAGQANPDTPIGHARIAQLRTFDARIAPCAYDKMPAPAELPPGGRCEVVYTDYGAQRLRVALDAGRAGETAADAEMRRLTQAVQGLGKAANSLIEVVPDPAKADWLIRLLGGRVSLVPATGWVKTADTAGAAPDARAHARGPDLFGPFALDDQVGRELDRNLGRIARARNLVSLASAAAGEEERGGSGTAFDLELLRFPDEKPGSPAEVVPLTGQGLCLHAGDVIAFRIHNRSRYAVDVSLLFVDSVYEISAFFPEEGTSTDNRLGPGKSLVTPKGRVSADTTGLEHMVAIIVKANTSDEPVNFNCLAETNLERAKSKTRGEPDRTLESQLGRVFQNALFGEGSRGLSRVATRDFGLRVLSWRSAPRTAPKP